MKNQIKPIKTGPRTVPLMVLLYNSSTQKLSILTFLMAKKRQATYV